LIKTREQALEYFTKYNYDHLPGKDPNTFKPFLGAKVLDIGANLGMVTAFWALNGSEVTSYEADPETYKIMTDMFARINIDVSAINAAVWTYTGQVSFKGVGHLDGTRECRNGNIESGLDSIFVPCVTLSQALGNTVWDCVKIDIESAEYAVLMSTDVEFLKNTRYMHLELHEDRHCPNDGWLTESQISHLREKLEPAFDIQGSVYSSSFWHLKNKKHFSL